MSPPAGDPGVFRVTALELPQAFGAVAETLDRIARALDALPPTDLVLLPEAIVTGYVSPRNVADLRPFAEAPDGPVARRLAALARDRGVALAGPVIERVGRRHYNALQLFDARGSLVARWRKRHPWVIERWATPGDLPAAVVSIAGVRITAAICYDVHFLEDDAPEALDAADVLLFPTAWVDDPYEDPDLRATLLSPLARAHGTWIVNANWAPSPPYLYGQGESRVVGPDGVERARTDLTPKPPLPQGRGGLKTAVPRALSPLSLEGEGVGGEVYVTAQIPIASAKGAIPSPP